MCGLQACMGPAIFGCIYIHPPFLMIIWCPQFQINISCPPPISKNIFFQKVHMRFTTFLHYPKRLDFIKYEVLCHWISLIWMTKSANKLIWMIKPLKIVDLRTQRRFFFRFQGFNYPTQFLFMFSHSNNRYSMTKYLKFNNIMSFGIR